MKSLGGGVGCRRKSSRFQILCVTVPLLIFGIIMVYILGISSAYFIFLEKIDRAADHLILLKRQELRRKTALGAFSFQGTFQEPKHNNYMIASFFQEVLNENLKVSITFDPSLATYNYNDTKLNQEFDNATQWYINPEFQSYEQLSQTQKKSLQELLPLSSIFRGLLLDDINSEQHFYRSAYYVKSSERMILGYPAEPNEAYRNWTRTEEPCDQYFESGRQEFYDARCRPYFKLAVEDMYDPINYGPYSNPDSLDSFYAFTLSQAIRANDKIHGVLNHDFNLNFRGKYDK